MYVAIASPPWSGSRAYNPCGLVHVEQRRAEEEHRREHEEGDQRRRPNRLVAEPVQDEYEHEAAEKDGDHERRKGAERVDVVGTRQSCPTPQHSHERQTFGKRSRNCERNEGEEGKRDEIEARENRDPLHKQRRKGDAAGAERDAYILKPRAEREPARSDVRGRPQRRADRRNEDPLERPRKLDDRRPDHRRADPERKRGPKASAIQT
jgi:hypothetical protein